MTFDISISFKPEAKNGLIFFKSQHSNNLQNGDFVSLELRDGKPVFKFNLGSGTAALKGKKPLEIQKWHTIKIVRDRRNATMTINGKETINGRINGKFQGLDLTSPLYLGGHPFYRQFGYSHNFRGCISHLEINSKTIEIAPNLVKSVDTATCDICGSSSTFCDNGGICQEAYNTEGYICICKQGYSGDKCEKEGFACKKGACGDGTCVNTISGFECKCPFGKIGEHCEKNIQINQPYFEDESYLAIREPKRILRA